MVLTHLAYRTSSMASTTDWLRTGTTKQYAKRNDSLKLVSMPATCARHKFIDILSMVLRIMTIYC